MEISWLPGKCLLCDSPSGRPMDLCMECESDLPWLINGCNVCALPLPTGAGSICGPCLTRPPSFSRTNAIFEYVWPVDQMIKRFKNHGNLAMGRVLSELLVTKLPGYPGTQRPDTLIPVPLHARKARKRGFNQSMEITSRLSKAWEIPIDRHCRRVHNTEEQKQLDINERFKNMRGGFSSNTL